MYSRLYALDEKTTIARLAFTQEWKATHSFSLGAEIGIQTGNRMRLRQETIDSLDPRITLPVFLNIKQPVDLLITGKYYWSDSYFLMGKVGPSYLTAVTDSYAITTHSSVLPETQLGFGWELSKRAWLALYYQYIFGNSPQLSHLDISNDTAVLSRLPPLQAAFLSIEWIL